MNETLLKKATTINIESEMQQSYLDYAMSVIVGRALPDIRDGLKPVHRRVLYAMHILKNHWNKPYKKSARVVGDVIGKYHPHGDTAVYDTIVRMAQPFSLRYLLIDGQGNFGSVDGDNAAAMRYTEIRMTKIAQELLADLEKETVDFVANYDGTEQMPEVMPAKIPNLLVNGSSGIAVGMATNIPPHNLSEIIKGCLYLLDNKEASIDNLIEIIKGPDFPTGAIINGHGGIVRAYRSGRGKLFIRSRCHIEKNDSSQRDSIIIDELPYQVNKALLIEKIAELVKEAKIEGIAALRDESDKDGMRVVIEVKNNNIAEIVLNNLYTQTALQSSFGINMVALVEGQPKTLNLKQMLDYFIQHRREIVTRRTLYLLRQARERSHILEGLAVAIANIDQVISLIKQSQTPAIAKQKLLEVRWQLSSIEAMLKIASDTDSQLQLSDTHYGLQKEGYYLLSPNQVQAVLDLRLHRLTGLEHDKLLAEYTELLDKIMRYLKILNDPDELTRIIYNELQEIEDQYGDERRTEIIHSHQDLTDEDLISEEERVFTLSHLGYANSQPLADYQAQQRGGLGKLATRLKEGDWIESLLVANTHDTLLCFSNLGKVYWLQLFQIPTASRHSRGRPMVNLLSLEEGEKITTVLPIKEFEDERYIIMATLKGTVKKIPLSAFSRRRSVGLRAIGLNPGDYLVETALANDNQAIMLFSSSGHGIRFKVASMRSLGRTARGVRGMRLKSGHRVVSLIIPQPDSKLLTLSEKGYGKQTQFDEFPMRNRAGQGVIAIRTSKRNGELVKAVQVFQGDEVMLISNTGVLIRTRVDEISTSSRNTQGVRVMRFKANEKLISLQRVEEQDELGEEAPETSSNGDSQET